MREIKFRGKRLDNGEWLYGNLVELRNPFNPNDAPACFIMPKEVNIAAPDSIAEQEVVDPDTVGQFTGRIDKNGKDIYEGDILIEPGIFDLPRTVFWDHRFMRFGNIAPSTCGYIALHDYSKPEVIGNIHDNPELLSNDEHEPGTSVN